MKTTKTTQVAMQWNTMDFPVLKGTPISLYGVIANDANAVGIVMEQINAKTDDALFTIMNGGIVDVSELDYSISADAMGAISGILFYQDNQRPYREDLDVIAQAEEAVQTAEAAVETAEGAVASAEAAAAAAADSVEQAESAVASLANLYDAESTYDIGDYVIYDGHLYRCTTAIPVAEAWNSAHWTEASLADDVEQKANPDGFYENMSVGNAEQLLASVYETEKVPYNFRTAGGSLNIGNRETDEIHGGSLSWNQLINNGNFEDLNYWTVSAGLTGSASNNIATLTSGGSIPQNIMNAGSGGIINFIAGHKVLVSFEVMASVNSTFSASLNKNAFGRFLLGDTPLTANTWTRLSYLAICDSDATGIKLGYKDANIIPVGETFSLKNINIFDLTLMFGSAIADYIYTLEQSNAGAGVAWFRRYFPKPYYAYDAGSMKSVKTSAHRMTGFNQWDEEWEVGHISSTGAEQAYQTIRSKNYCRCVPGVSLYGHIGDTSTILYLAFYDADKNFILRRDFNNRVNDTPQNASYFKITTDSEYGTTYKHDICINLHWDGERDGEYEPYKLNTYSLDPDLELRGVYKLDANNSLYCDGDIYQSDGTVKRNFVEMEFDGDENWIIEGSGTANWFYRCDTGIGAVANEILSNHYVQASIGYSTTETGISIISSGAIRIREATEGTVPNFKTKLSNNPLKVIFKVSTPTTEEADPYAVSMIVDDFGTEEYVDEREVAVPVGHVTQYMPDLKAKLETAAESPDGNGDYILRQTNGVNTYVPLVIPDELPAAPSEDGTYTLQVVVSGGVATYSWVSA